MEDEREMGESGVGKKISSSTISFFTMIYSIMFSSARSSSIMSSLGRWGRLRRWRRLRGLEMEEGGNVGDRRSLWLRWRRKGDRGGMEEMD